MNKKSFYVTLLSNSSVKLYPNNTLSSYTTKLARRIILTGQCWEIALVEMRYYSAIFEKNISFVITVIDIVKSVD